MRNVDPASLDAGSRASIGMDCDSGVDVAPASLKRSGDDAGVAAPCPAKVLTRKPGPRVDHTFFLHHM